MSRVSYDYTEEQREFEIEERLKELLPADLQEEYNLQRKYVVEATEGRIPTRKRSRRILAERGKQESHELHSNEQTLTTRRTTLIL